MLDEAHRVDAAEGDAGEELDAVLCPSPRLHDVRGQLLMSCTALGQFTRRMRMPSVSATSRTHRRRGIGLQQGLL